MPPRPSAVLAPARTAFREAFRAAVLFSGGTVGGLVLVVLGRVAL